MVTSHLWSGYSKFKESSTIEEIMAEGQVRGDSSPSREITITKYTVFQRESFALCLWRFIPHLIFHKSLFPSTISEIFPYRRHTDNVLLSLIQNLLHMWVVLNIYIYRSGSNLVPIPDWLVLKYGWYQLVTGMYCIMDKSNLIWLDWGKI